TMAAADVAIPVHVPTGAGTRELIDLGNPVLKLQKLDNPQVSLNQLGQRYGAQALRSIFEKLTERGLPTTFEEIDLSDNLIGDEGALYLKQGLSESATLKRLIAPRSGIRSEGFASIGGLIATTPNLEMLVLSSNLADAAGVAGEFSSGLSKNKSLRKEALKDAQSPKKVKTNAAHDFRKQFKEGQKNMTPPVSDATRAFYESLLQENPDSHIAIRFAVENGIMPLDEHKKLLKKYNHLKEKGAFSVAVKLARALEKKRKLGGMKVKKDKKAQLRCSLALCLRPSGGRSESLRFASKRPSSRLRTPKVSALQVKQEKASALQVKRASKGAAVGRELEDPGHHALFFLLRPLTEAARKVAANLQPAPQKEVSDTFLGFGGVLAVVILQKGGDYIGRVAFDSLEAVSSVLECESLEVDGWALSPMGRVVWGWRTLAFRLVIPKPVGESSTGLKLDTAVGTHLSVSHAGGTSVLAAIHELRQCIRLIWGSVQVAALLGGSGRIALTTLYRKLRRSQDTDRRNLCGWFIISPERKTEMSVINRTFGAVLDPVKVPAKTEAQEIVDTEEGPLIPEIIRLLTRAGVADMVAGIEQFRDLTLQVVKPMQLLRAGAQAADGKLCMDALSAIDELDSEFSQGGASVATSIVVALGGRRALRELLANSEVGSDDLALFAAQAVATAAEERGTNAALARGLGYPKLGFSRSKQFSAQSKMGFPPSGPKIWTPQVKPILALRGPDIGNHQSGDDRHCDPNVDVQAAPLGPSGIEQVMLLRLAGRWERWEQQRQRHLEKPQLRNPQLLRCLTCWALVFPVCPVQLLAGVQFVDSAQEQRPCQSRFPNCLVSPLTSKVCKKQTSRLMLPLSKYAMIQVDQECGLGEFGVVSCVPARGSIGQQTEIVCSGLSVPVLTRVQLTCLEASAGEEDEDENQLYQDSVKPWLVKHRETRRQDGCHHLVVVSQDQVLTIKGIEFGVRALDPAGRCGAIDASTSIFVSYVETPVLTKVHVLPYGDTLPAAYSYDIFGDFIRPFLREHPFAIYGLGDHFAYRGVRFRVMATDPPQTAARVIPLR
ncbi:unnamed protein product, partial [Polarella glacialis]